MPGSNCNYDRTVMSIGGHVKNEKIPSMVIASAAEQSQTTTVKYNGIAASPLASRNDALGSFFI